MNASLLLGLALLGSPENGPPSLKIADELNPPVRSVFSPRTTARSQQRPSP